MIYVKGAVERIVVRCNHSASVARDSTTNSLSAQETRATENEMRYSVIQDYHTECGPLRKTARRTARELPPKCGITNCDNNTNVTSRTWLIDSPLPCRRRQLLTQRCFPSRQTVRFDFARRTSPHVSLLARPRSAHPLTRIHERVRSHV